MIGFRKFIESSENAGTIREICRAMLNRAMSDAGQTDDDIVFDNDFRDRMGIAFHPYDTEIELVNPDDIGFQHIIDILADLGNELKARLIAAGLQATGEFQIGNTNDRTYSRVDRNGFARNLVVTGSRGFISPDDIELVGLHRRNYPAVTVYLKYSDLLASGLFASKTDVPDPQNYLVMLPWFHLTQKAVDAAIAKQMGVEQLYGNNLKAADVNFDSVVTDYGPPTIDLHHRMGGRADVEFSQDDYNRIVGILPELLDRGLASFGGAIHDHINYRYDIENYAFIKMMARRWIGLADRT
jgi:hypothetical protein